MTTEEIKLKFPIGKLYQIVFNRFDDDFQALINDKSVTFPSKETVFLMLDIECLGNYCKITALFPSGQAGTISYLYPKEIKML
jgi:hypothetical protein